MPSGTVPDRGLVVLDMKLFQHLLDHTGDICGMSVYLFPSTRKHCGYKPQGPADEPSAQQIFTPHTLTVFRRQ